MNEIRVDSRSYAALLAALALLLLAAPARAQHGGEATATVRIDMRGPIADGWFDPKTEKVGVRGALAPLSWESTAPASDPDGDGVYEVELRFSVAPGPAAFAPHKFKVDGTGNPDDGWESGPNRALLLPRALSVSTRAFNAPGDRYPSTLAGDLRTHAGFASAHVAARDVYVLLPPGYDREPGRSYPVLYMHDGQNLFDAATAYSGEWRVDETAGALAQAGRAEPVIVVGVANGGEARIDEYTPTRASIGRGRDAREAGGRAAAYGRFLVEELKPFVDRTYRTKSGPADTALGGSSLGGLVTLYLGLEYPSVFGTLLVVSPSVWWGREAIVARVRALRAPTRQRVWLDIGSGEGRETVAATRRLRDALVAKGWRLGESLHYVEARGAGHDEAAWADRFDDMLLFAFPRRR